MLNHGWPCICVSWGKVGWLELLRLAMKGADISEWSTHRELKFGSSYAGYKAEGQRERISSNGVRQRWSILQYTSPSPCPCPTYNREDMDVPWSGVWGGDVRVGGTRGENTMVKMSSCQAANVVIWLPRRRPHKKHILKRMMLEWLLWLLPCGTAKQMLHIGLSKLTGQK